jgi:hypothetical protein
VYASSEHTRLADPRPALELNPATEARTASNKSVRAFSCINSVVKRSRGRAQEMCLGYPHQSLGTCGPVYRRPGVGLGLRHLRLHRQFGCRYGLFVGLGLARQSRIHLH